MPSISVTSTLMLEIGLRDLGGDGLVDQDFRRSRGFHVVKRCMMMSHKYSAA